MVGANIPQGDPRSRVRPPLSTVRSFIVLYLNSGCQWTANVGRYVIVGSGVGERACADERDDRVEAEAGDAWEGACRYDASAGMLVRRGGEQLALLARCAAYSGGGGGGGGGANGWC